jgi:predicted amidohydrolase
MTAHKNLKRLVRERVSRTGETYTAALQQVRVQRELGGPLRLAVGQLPVEQDPTDPAALRRAGDRLRQVLRSAAAAGARVVHLPEGATCFPGKRVLSSTGPDVVGPADWDRVAWAVLDAELAETAALAGRLGIWAVFGSTHRLSGDNRPHNCLYVVADDGRVRTRYDERYLSHTKAQWMYSPGRAPVVVEVDGWRLGLALGVEAHFPEVFAEYDRLDVDAVLFSSTGDGGFDATTFAVEAAGHAAVHGFWVGFAVPPQTGDAGRAGVVAPGGRWVGRVGADGGDGVVVVDLDRTDPDVAVARTLARPWRRRVGADPHRELLGERLLGDARSLDRAGF